MRLKKLENRITRTSDQLEAKIGVDNKQLKEQLLQEVNSVRDLIPTIPSFEPLEKKIEEVRGLIPKIPKELTADQLVDKINTLEEAIDISTIKDLKKKLEDLEKKWTSRPMFGGGGMSKMALDMHFIDDETPTNSGDSLNFTIAHTPSPTSSLKVYRNGQRLKIGASNDYTFTGYTITLLVALGASEILTADYKI